jgi:hypothetical protein
VRVAAGPPTDTTTVFIPLAVPPVAVAGRPDSAWVAPQQDEPGSSYEIEVFPSTSPVGIYWYAVGAASRAVDVSDIASRVDLGHGLTGWANDTCSTFVQWQQGGNSHSIEGPSTLSKADAITVAKAFVAALAEGSEAHGRVVSTDAELVAVR